MVNSNEFEGAGSLLYVVDLCVQVFAGRGRRDLRSTPTAVHVDVSVPRKGKTMNLQDTQPADPE